LGIGPRCETIKPTGMFAVGRIPLPIMRSAERQLSTGFARDQNEQAAFAYVQKRLWPSTSLDIGRTGRRSRLQALLVFGRALGHPIVDMSDLQHGLHGLIVAHSVSPCASFVRLVVPIRRVVGHRTYPFGIQLRGERSVTHNSRECYLVAGRHLHPRCGASRGDSPTRCASQLADLENAPEQRSQLSVDHFVGGQSQVGRDFEPQRLRRLEVEGQHEQRIARGMRARRARGFTDAGWRSASARAPNGRRSSTGTSGSFPSEVRRPARPSTGCSPERSPGHP
jgi:hypothetical protein